MKKLLVFLLSCSLAASNLRAQEKPEANAAGVGVAIVVVCVGGYCIYKTIRFCQKKFPKDKLANTNELYSFSGGAGDEYGGSWNHGSLGSCPPDATGKSALLSGTASPTLFVLNVTVESTTSLKIAMASSRNEDSWQSWADFQADVTSHGLTITGRADGSQYFSLNGSPVSAGEVPLRFDTVTGQVIHDRGGELVSIVIEASTDLENWQRLASVVHGVGEGFQIADVSGEDKTFYRVLIAP